MNNVLLILQTFPAQLLCLNARVILPQIHQQLNSVVSMPSRYSLVIGIGCIPWMK